MHARWTARRVATIAGVAAGTLVGATLGLLADAGTAQREGALSAPWLEATHLPPLLTTGGEPVELRYDAYCHAEEDVDEPCAVDASVYARPGQVGAFRELAVREERGAPEGRLVARVPEAMASARAGFSYYAVLRDRGTGATTTVPAGGADAPQVSRPLGEPAEISLGAHRFGRVRRASERVASARWGSGPGEVGLEPGKGVMPAGGSSFAVGHDGAVHVLDHANRRLLTWNRGAAGAVARPLAIEGTLADLALTDDGTAYVLETTSRPGGAAVVRAFDARGRPLGTTPVAERASQLRAEDGVVRALEQPSGQWMEVFTRSRPATKERQTHTGSAGRQTKSGDELVVLRTGDEIRVALAGTAGVRRSWRIASSTPLGEVQLAELVDRSVVVVARVYTDAEAEFRVLVLGPRGLAQSFSVAASDWAETAPLSRFRVAAGSLFQLGSAPDGLFVDRYDLEVER